MPKTTSISCEGDRVFVDALGALARRRGTTMGALVRQTLDKEHGKELAPLIEQAALFFGYDGTRENTSDRGSTEHGR